MRARNLKPEFFTDKKIAALGMAAALVFEALWVTADDGGVAQCDAVSLKGQMFMRWEELSVEVIERALCRLAEAGRVQHYVIGDREYYRTLSWEKNQSVHNASQFRHPRAEQKVAESKGKGLPQEDGSPVGAVPLSSPPIHLNSSTPPHPSKNGNGVEAAFEELWSIYPTRAGGNSKADALAAFNARLKQGATAEQMVSGTRRYAAFCEATEKVGTEYVKQARTFLGKGRHYLEPYDLPPSNAATHTNGNGKRRGPKEYDYSKPTDKPGEHKWT